MGGCERGYCTASLGLTLANPGPHGAILRAAAKANLVPLGMRQKGRSRTWLGDHGWWLAVVEFQPSSWSKGSYLNVACMWLWHPQNHISFNVYERMGGYAEFKDEDSFRHAAENLARLAAEGTLRNEQRFRSIDAALQYLEAVATGSQNPWDHYHPMMAALACRRIERAKDHLRSLLALSPHADWGGDLQAHSKRIIAAAARIENPESVVAEQVALARAQLALEPTHIPPWSASEA